MEIGEIVRVTFNVLIPKSEVEGLKVAVQEAIGHAPCPVFQEEVKVKEPSSDVFDDPAIADVFNVTA